MEQATADAAEGVPAIDEPRIVTETGVAARIAALAAPLAREHGFRLVRVRISSGPVQVVQVMAERPDGSFTIGDCATLSRDLSPTLDVDNPIDGVWNLEVSSPGIDRPLVRRSDFAAALGLEIKLELTRAHAGQRRWRGVLERVDAAGFALRSESGEPVEFTFDSLAMAKIVMSDALFAQTFAKNGQRGEKHGRKQ